jgi:succinate dehydrogenase / fumarate reductase cytochrome b subunit
VNSANPTLDSQNYFLSSAGLKLIMGLSGAVWALFVFVHMAGNMLLFVSSDAYNLYGHFLTSGYFIYIAEAVLIAALLAHVVCAVVLTKRNRAARGEHRYVGKASGNKKISLASRTMAIQGSLILFFIITHLATFKFGTVYTTVINGVEVRDLHRLVVEVFAQPVYVLWYVVALVILAFHLSHGFGSIFQSLGLENRRTQPLIKKASIAYALVVAGGFLAQPIAYFLFNF